MAHESMRQEIINKSTAHIEQRHLLGKMVSSALLVAGSLVRYESVIDMEDLGSPWLRASTTYANRHYRLIIRESIASIF